MFDTYLHNMATSNPETFFDFAVTKINEMSEIRMHMSDLAQQNLEVNMKVHATLDIGKDILKFEIFIEKEIDSILYSWGDELEVKSDIDMAPIALRMCNLIMDACRYLDLEYNPVLLY